MAVNSNAMMPCPLATYCYNIAPSVDERSPFYLLHGRDPLEGRPSNLQNYCRYVGDQPVQLAVQELRKMWKLHANLHKENRRIVPVENKIKITKATDLKLGQLVFVKKITKRVHLIQLYIYDHRFSEILNDSMVMLITQDGKKGNATSTSSN